MVRGVRLRRWVGICAVSLLCLAGCENGWGRRKLPPESPPRLAPSRGPILVGTIGAVTYLASVVGQPVRGFGVVVGLKDNGSGDCPTVIREHLVETMNKEVETWTSLQQRRRFSAGELIDSLSTAVVEVVGLVPAGARQGVRFDIHVQAIPGTSTRSLAGGLLLPCELRLSDVTGTDEDLLGGTTVAHAGGPVFVNPFTAQSDDGAAGDRRHGYVLSGGQTVDERTTRLLLREPSYPMARRIERRINERFGQRPDMADARSRGYLVLHTPPEFTHRPEDFIRMVTHLYLDDHPALMEKRLRELARLVVLPDAAYEDIALAWEGIGRTAVAHIQPLYTHENPHVRFYAARAGLRLKDVNAVSVLVAIAKSAQPGLALLAVQELGRCPYPQAGLELSPLLDSRDQQLRIAAYEALREHRHPSIRSLPYRSSLDQMQLNMALDVVESEGPPLIYVRRTRLPRIAVFGSRTPVRLPLFYTDEEDSITLNALEDAGDITLFTKRGRELSEPILVPPRVVDLIARLADLPVKDAAGQVRGAGLPYSQVVQVLAALCRDGTIPVRLEIERLSLTEMYGPDVMPERPEADELPALEEPAEHPEAAEPLLPPADATDEQP